MKILNRSSQDHPPIHQEILVNLIITHYLDRSPEHVRDHLATTIPQAIRAAADRVSRPVTESGTDLTDTHAVVHGGLDVLDGAAIDWDGDDDLTTVRVSIPWAQGDDARGHRILAANRFAHVLSAGVRNAA
jgi:hypothetical protein